jgi:hypothetical protein
VRKILGAFALVSLLAPTLVSTTRAQDETKAWTGWISDGKCKLAGMSANHKRCAAYCVKNLPEKWVLVESGTKQVLLIDNQEAVNPDSALGHEIRATGHATHHGSIHIDGIEPAHTK